MVRRLRKSQKEHIIGEYYFKTPLTVHKRRVFLFKKRDQSYLLIIR